MEQLRIKVAEPQDYQFILDCGEKQGWNPGIYDVECYRNADQNGLFVGKIGNQRVCYIFGLKYQNNFSFIGYYIVKPEFRKKGYGSKIWNYCMDYLKGSENIGLYAALDMKDKYADKFGFKFYNFLNEYEGIGIDNYQEDKNIVPLKDVQFQSLLQYDKEMNPAYRPKFLKYYIQMPDSLAVGYVQQNKLRGYIVVKKLVKGYRAAPLFADSNDIANSLLLKARKFVGSNHILQIDVPDHIEHAVKLIQSHGFKKIYVFASMFMNGYPKADQKRIYAITAIQIG